jgi:hypothetical protein
MRTLREGMELYIGREKQALLAAWEMGSTTEAMIRARFEPQSRQISIHG